MDSSVPSIPLPDLPFSLELLPQSAYIVGGAVRDAILGRTREYLDLDFVLPSNAVKVAREIATHYKAGFVLLDPQRHIARVVFPEATADFAQQEGNCLETDLHRRDFTINAIAYNPHTQEIIDPLQGSVDLQRRLLRMISPTNLEDDPLRLMRAYRQAAQLGFTIEPDTQTTIRSLASQITKVAPERVRVELGYMLANPQGSSWIVSAWQDGLLAPVFKSATQESLTLLTAVDNAASQLTEIWQQLGVELAQYVRDTIKTTWLSIAKLASLVNPNPEIAEMELIKLTYSRAEIKAVTTTIKLLPLLQETQMSLREQYFFFQEAGIVFPAIAVLAVADNMTLRAISQDKTREFAFDASTNKELTCGRDSIEDEFLRLNDCRTQTPRSAAPLHFYACLISRYLNPDDLVAHPTPLLSGRDIMLALNIPASPLVGKLLTEIAVAQIEGRVSTAEAAIKFAFELLKS